MSLTGENITFKNTYKPWLVSLILFFGDSIAIVISFLFSGLVRSLIQPIIGGVFLSNVLIRGYFIIYCVIIFLFIVSDFYPGSKRIGVKEIKDIFTIVTTSFIILVFIFYSLRFGNNFSRLIFFFSWITSLFSISLLRLIIHNRGSLFCWWNEPTLIVGRYKDIRKIFSLLLRARRLAIQPIYGLRTDLNISIEEEEPLPIIDFSDDSLKRMRALGLKQVLYVNDSTNISLHKKRDLNTLSELFPKVIFFVGDFSLGSLFYKPIDIDGFTAFQITFNLLNSKISKLKRIFDILFSILIILFLSPVLLIVYLLIILDSPGPAIFSQKRVGKGGKIFNIYKFRTMKNESEFVLKDIVENDPVLLKEYEKYHKIKNDPRITKIGVFLRRTSIDEFPQFINVLKGDMSIVGPRAYLPEEISELKDANQIIQRVLPGITGWWQVMGRHELIFEERIRLDEVYISNFSLWLDLYIILKTVGIMLLGKGR